MPRNISYKSIQVLYQESISNNREPAGEILPAFLLFTKKLLT